MPLFITILSFLLSPVYGTEPEWVQTGCTLRGKNNQSKRYPGYLCIFQEDGTLLSVGGKSLKKISKESEVLWEVPGQFHHQMNLSTDKSRILILGSEIATVEKKKRRQDIIFVIDQAGKILFRTTTEEIVKPLGKEPMQLTHQSVGAVGADYETSHFNSIYEIPKNARAKELSWLKPGNIIVNSLLIGVFILGPDLKTMIKHFDYHDLSFNHFLHDVQVTPEGNFLFYNNTVRNDVKKSYSAIQEIDPVTKKIVFEFTASPKEMFFSLWGGGVQRTGEYLLFSHAQNGGFLYSLKEKDVVKTYPLDLEQSAPRWIQDIKVPAPGFLKNSK